MGYICMRSAEAKMRHGQLRWHVADPLVEWGRLPCGPGEGINMMCVRLLTLLSYMRSRIPEALQ